MCAERYYITYFEDKSFLVFGAADGELALEYADFRAGQVNTNVIGLSEITCDKASELNPNIKQEVGQSCLNTN